MKDVINIVFETAKEVRNLLKSNKSWKISDKLKKYLDDFDNDAVLEVTFNFTNLEITDLKHASEDYFKGLFKKTKKEVKKFMLRKNTSFAK